MATKNEIAPEIASIAAQAAADEALKTAAEPVIDQQGNVVEQPAPVDYVGEASEIVELAFDGLSPIWPSLAHVYTPEVRGKIAQRAAPLMEKYGLTFGGMLEKWGAEIMFAVTVVPLIAPTAKAIAADNLAAKIAAGEVTADETKPKDTGLRPVVDTTDADSLHNKA
jgi:hypothetical protein